MISNIDQIVSRSNLLDVISQVAHVDWIRAGSNMKCISPFSPDEKTGSFLVNERKGIWKCFSSGFGGKSAISFIMKYRNCSFLDAVRELSDIVSEPIIYDNGMTYEEAKRRSIAEKSKKELLLQAHKRTHDFYLGVSNFRLNDDGKVDLAGKLYLPTTVEKWGMTLTGDGQLLSKASATWEERNALVDAGILAASTKTQGYYDFFYGRLLFPLYDQYMQIVGFNGRLLDKDAKGPKYLNSPASSIFNKSDFLYGFSHNWRNISTREQAYLVEGPTDVILLDQYGINNAVCSSGTAFTADQAKKLATVCDMVIIVFDGDEAGQKATAKAIKLIIAAQLEAKVKILPDNHDPASFISEHGEKAFKDIKLIDGIEYLINLDIPDPSKAGPHELGAAMNTVTNVLADITDESIRAQYIQAVYKRLHTTVTVLKNAVKAVINERLEGNNRLTPEQEKTKQLYGIYIDKDRYYDHNGIEISNFIVKPLFLATYNNTANRIFEITNKYGHSKVLNVNSDDFITLMGFRRATEMLGSYIFKGNDAQFTKIREWIYNEMKEVFPIETLGFQNRYKIYAWSNGIIAPGTSDFQPVDEYGIVEYKSPDMERPVNFLLPAESKVFQSHDDDNDRELEDNFKYIVNDPNRDMPHNFEQWAYQFKLTFGKNAAVALCWIVASIHRDMLHKRYDLYPHLNLFGPAGSGKTFMAQIITGVFGKPMRAVHLVSSSHVAFYRRAAQTRNAIVWYEEYSEKVNPEKQEALKNFADGFGRVTGQKSNDNKTKSFPVLNAAIISGQVLPTHDPALLERCITLYFDKFYGDKKAQKQGERFKSWTNEGLFACVASEIFSYRDYIAERFADKMEEVRDMLRMMFDKSMQPSDRVLNNYAMIASVYFILSEKISLPFATSQILDEIVERIIDQTKSVEGADELSGFFKVIEFMVARFKENENQGLSYDHYAVEMHASVTIKVTEKETREIIFDKPTKLLFLRMNYAHSLYAKEGKAMVNRVIEKNTLLHYMHQHRAWVGEMKAKKINDTPKRCVVFNLDLLPDFDFEITNYLPNNNLNVKKDNNILFDQNESNNGIKMPDLTTIDPFS